MERWLPLIGVVLALIAISLLVLRIWRRRQMAAFATETQSSEDEPTIDMKIYEDEDGKEVAQMDAASDNSPLSVLKKSPLWARGLAAFILAILLGGLLSQLPEFLFGRSVEDFTVLVAPFDDSGDGQTGREVAAELVQAIRREASGDDMIVFLLDSAPTNTQHAYAIAAERKADVLIWGSVRPGGMFDSQSLEPSLIYQPTGRYAPYAWDGYIGRFAIPASFQIAVQPLNGRVVLPPLLQALAEYGRGEADAAYIRMGRLLDEYGQDLNTALPRFIRGNALWARGMYAEAAGEYRRAVNQPHTETALLVNNLAAILFDSGEFSAARGEMDAAVGLLAGNDLGELRFNLGLYHLAEQRVDQAATEFEQARNLLPHNAEIYLALSEAYRQQRDFDQSSLALAEAEQRVEDEVARASETLQPLLRQRLEADLAEQRGLLTLAQSIDARNPLIWELELDPPLSPDVLSQAGADLNQAVQTSTSVLQGWRKLEASQAVYAADLAIDDLAVDRQQGMLVASGQARRAAWRLNRQRYYLALMREEEGRIALRQERRGVWRSMGALFGSEPPAESAQSLLDHILAINPDDLDALNAYGRAQRIQRLREDRMLQQHNSSQEALIAERCERISTLDAQAIATYRRIRELHPQHPEGFYGEGMVAFYNGDDATARNWMEQALVRDADFFPARDQLARIAERAGNWIAAVDQLDLLIASYPADASYQLRLASALRHSGAEQFARAERALFSILEANPEYPTMDRVAAFVELGRLYRDAGKDENATAVLQEALVLNERLAEAHYELGRTLALQRKYDSAESHLKSAITYDSQHTPVLLALGDLYQQQSEPGGPDEPISVEKLAQANEHYRLALQANVDDAARLRQIGDTLLSNESYDVAAEAFQEIIKLQMVTCQPGDDPYARHGLARAYIGRGDLAKAQEEEQQAIQLTLSIDNAESRAIRALATVGLGDIERLNGRFNNAIALYNEAMRIDDAARFDATMGLGHAAVGLNNWIVALGHFRLATQLPDGQDDTMAHFWFAEALLRQPNPSQASEVYQSVLKVRPDFPPALFGMAQAKYGQGDMRNAEAYVMQAIKGNETYAEALMFRGKMFQEQGRLSEALDDYNASIAANDSFAETFYRRALIYIYRKDYGQAANDLQRAVTLQENFPEAWYWLGRAQFAQNSMLAALDSFEKAIEWRGGSYTEARLYKGLTELALAETDPTRREAAITSLTLVEQADPAGAWGNRARSELECLEQPIFCAP